MTFLYNALPEHLVELEQRCVFLLAFDGLLSGSAGGCQSPASLLADWVFPAVERIHYHVMRYHVMEERVAHDLVARLLQALVSTLVLWLDFRSFLEFLRAFSVADLQAFRPCSHPIENSKR